MVWPELQPAAQQLVESIVAGVLNGQVSAKSWVKCACAAMAGASGHGQQRWIVHPRHLVALRPARECGPWGEAHDHGGNALATRFPMALCRVNR